MAPKNVFEVESVFSITVRLANKLVFVLEHFLGSRGMVRSAVTIKVNKKILDFPDVC